eukprot:c4783_g1_i2.p1 GENE.c4783_g1_i2~~c4783_g1_i2.p1  ORF type:complete len:205 (-),score=62.40 c4783_g1_i2:22-636(-)
MSLHLHTQQTEGFGGVVVGGFENGCVSCWDMRQVSVPLWSLQSHKDSVTCVAFSSSMRYGFTAGADHAVTCLHTKQNTIQQNNAINTINHNINQAEQNTSSASSASLPTSSSVVRVSPPVPSVPFYLSGTAGDIAMRHDERLIAYACWDSHVRIFQLRHHKPLAVLKYHTGSCYSVAFCSQSRVLASGGKDGRIALWDVYSEKD